MLRMLRATLALSALLALVACGGGDEPRIARSGLPVSTTSSTEAPEDGGEAGGAGGGGEVLIDSPQDGDTIEGNVVSLQLTATGVQIVKADGDQSGETSHYHVFIDRDPVPVGQVIPKEPGIIHTTEDTVVVPGLAPGEHRLVVTLGDGAHSRISEELTAEVTVSVEGPSIKANAPATLPAGQDLVIDVQLTGVTLGPPEGTHLHFIVDGELPPQKEAIPKDKEGIIHTPETSVTIPGLDPGEHTIWVVVGDANHVPLAPPVVDRVTVTVQ